MAEPATPFLSTRAKNLIVEDPRIVPTLRDVAKLTKFLDSDQWKILDPFFHALDPGQSRLYASLITQRIEPEHERSIKHIITGDEKTHRHASARRFAKLLVNFYQAELDIGTGTSPHQKSSIEGKPPLLSAHAGTVPDRSQMAASTQAKKKSVDHRDSLVPAVFSPRAVDAATAAAAAHTSSTGARIEAISEELADMKRILRAVVDRIGDLEELLDGLK